MRKIYLNNKKSIKQSWKDLQVLTSPKKIHHVNKIYQSKRRITFLKQYKTNYKLLDSLLKKLNHAKIVQIKDTLKK